MDREQKLNSIRAVMDFADNKESFLCKANVIVERNNKTLYTYKDISISTTYNVGYMQMEVNVYWEEDSNQDEHYKNRGLYGTYNTNYQKMNCINDTLCIEDREYKILISR